MRTINLLFIGGFISMAFGVSIANGWFAPSVQSHPDFLKEHNARLIAEFEQRRTADELNRAKVLLDAYRRGERNPVDEGGAVVPAEGLIPAPAVPLPVAPLPVNPKANDPKDEVNDVNDEPTHEEGEEVGMAEATKTTAIAKSLVINTVDELYRVAEILYRGGASQLPNVGSPNHVFHLILHGMEIGLTPTQSLAGLSMGKNGKPSIMGDAALALVMQSGLLEDIKEFREGEGDDCKGVCIVKRKNFPDHRRFEFTTAQAEQAGLIKRAKNEKGDGPWLAYRDRMLRYRPLGYALRDVFPDVLKGLHLTEEMQEANDPNLVNTEVKVLGTTSDAPANVERTTLQLQQQIVSTVAAIAQPETAPATTVSVATIESVAPATTQPYVITQAEANELRRLKSLAMAARNVSDPVAQKAEWEQILAPYGVSTVRQMSQEAVGKLIADLGAKHDPFSYGQSNPARSAA